jgi:glycosyltransferase involved in cell wall biosynthesis
LPNCDFVFAGWGPIDPAKWALPNVRVAGSLAPDRLAELFRAADLLVLPSVGEGFPLVVQEAMACGTPAIISLETAAGFPGASDWAIAVDPTAEAVAAAVRAALADRERVGRRRAEVAAVARAEWDWDRCAAAYTEMFRRMLADD